MHFRVQQYCTPKGMKFIKSSARKSLMGEPRIITLFQYWTFDCLKGQMDTLKNISIKNSIELIAAFDIILKIESLCSYSVDLMHIRCKYF